MLQSLLHGAEPPRITSHPEDSNSGISDIHCPSNWNRTTELQLAVESNQGWREWGVAAMHGCRGVRYHHSILSVQKSNEASYHCVISNCASSQMSETAKLEVSWSIINALKEASVHKVWVSNTERAFVAAALNLKVLCLLNNWLVVCLPRVHTAAFTL